jgi:hypothetical protein
MRNISLFVIFALLFCPSARAAEFHFPAATVRAGELVNLPVMVDEVSNLAGLKLVIRYDNGLLEFKKISKTRWSASLIHVVNDKKPGMLTVVMAGARGIKGKDFPVLFIGFKAKKPSGPRKTVLLEVHECQIMGAGLKEIPCTVKVDPITILP